MPELTFTRGVFLFPQAFEVYQQAQTLWPDNKDLATKLRSLGKLVKMSEKKDEVGNGVEILWPPRHNQQLAGGLLG